MPETTPEQRRFVVGLEDRAGAPHNAEPEPLRRARQAIRDAIIEETPTHVIFDDQALHHAYELLMAAQPEWERNFVCGKLSVGFPVRGDDYEDAPNED